MQAPRPRFTFAEYVALEEIAQVKHEYFGGQVFAMAGGSPEHAALAANVVALLADGCARRPVASSPRI